ncbi:2,3-butanediol dehydrogenase [Natronomonas salsuginis]|uniref:2,3-butanediol dehydrogenase n=1 Tax=Natronomonas salsuginis TaxID=2217661 RepID=A0A4U5JD38_9EURY|nr:2,3-butanediol dehydrogenase [Natronomonas salsuginis]TKR26176.1 2,3-butanediol dehydrogenase [Natronomonas salsuginis]
MRAAVYHGPEDVRIEDVPQRPLGATDVRIGVAACGICGSDLHEYRSGPMLIPEERPHPITGATLPLVMGHEFAGEVIECGADVSGVEPGDRVTVNPILYCGDCRYCDRGAYHLCSSGGFLGLTGRGGFAETAVVSADSVVKLPDGVDYAGGALIEPLSVAVHAIRQSGLQLGDTVAVLGAGPIGLAVVAAARAAGARTIVASEPQPDRRELAVEFGADVAVDPTTDDAVDVVRDHTDGGADVAFEVAGIEATFNQAIRATAKNGTVAAVGIFEDDVTMGARTAIPGERAVVGTLGYEGGPLAALDFKRTLALLERGAFDPSTFVTARIGLDEIVEAGFEALLDGGEHVKVLVEP